MPSVSPASQISAANFSSDLNTENKQPHLLRQQLNEARNAVGGMEMERGIHREAAQKMTKLNEKLLESRNINPDKAANVSRTLSQANPVVSTGEVVKHDQLNTSGHVKAQAEGIDQLDAPSRAMDTRGTVSVGDAHRIAQYVVDTLKYINPKKYENLKSEYNRIEKMPPGSSYSNKNLHEFYSFFEYAEANSTPGGLGVDGFRPRSDKADEADELKHLSRIMKWHFRSGLCTQMKESLDIDLNKRLAYIEQGGSRSSETGIKYVQSLAPAGVVGGSVQVSNKNTLSSTPAGEIKSSSGLEVSVGVGLLSGLAELGLDFGTTKTKKYSTLADYVSANSVKFKTWFDESKFTAVVNLDKIIKLAINYDDDIRKTHMSRPFLLDKLSKAGLADIKVDLAQRRVRPVEVHDVQKKAVNGQASLSCFFGLSGKLSVSQETGTKNKYMDIIDLMEVDKNVARKFIKNEVSIKNGHDLVQSMRAHVEFHSRVYTNEILRGGNEEKVLTNCKDDASRILADYVLSKAAGVVDMTSERTIQDILSEHSMLLRPDSLIACPTSTPIKRNVCSAAVSVNDPLKLLDAKAEVKLISVVEYDDPHCLGEFVELELAGEIKTMDGLHLLVNKLLDSMGKPSPSLATLSSSLGSAALHQSHGASSQTLVKIKDGVPLMLVQQTFTNVSDNTKATIPTIAGSSLKLSSEASLKTLLSETLGVQTLDYILPIARKKIKDVGHSGEWDTYVAAHGKDFKQLVLNIADLKSYPALEKEIKYISGLNTTAQSLSRLLLDSAVQAKEIKTDESYKAALTHLKNFLAHYISTDYYQNVQKK